MRPNTDNNRNEEHVRLPNISKVEFTGTEFSTKPKALSIAGFEIKHLMPKKRSSATAVTTGSQERQMMRLVQLPNEGVLNIRTINVRKQAREQVAKQIDKTSLQSRQRERRILSNLKTKSPKPQHETVLLRPPLKPKSDTSSQQLNRLVNKLIAASFGVVAVPISPPETFKAFVDKGNNSVLVKQTLKGRSWWNIVTEEDKEKSQMALNWTEFRQKALVVVAEERIESEVRMQISKAQVNMLLENPYSLKIITDSMEPTTADIMKVVKRFNEQARYTLEPRKVQLSNHIPENNQITNKKALFKNMSKWYMQQQKDPFDFIPVTFHVSSTDDEQFAKFMEYAAGLPKKKSLWVVKPGENTNRGNGITVEKGGAGVKEHLESIKTKHTHIIQSYIRPYLYNQRKFDIRCYAMVVMINKKLKGYWYDQGYIRTASEHFSYKKTDKMIHLTNDAVQKYGQNYGKYQPGNKLSYQQLAKYILTNNQRDFAAEVVPKMKSLCRDIFQSVQGKLGADRSEDAFQVYGLDFMLDEDLKPWIIEVNTNPCLELSSSLLSRIIPEMLDNAFRIAMDPFLWTDRKLVSPADAITRKNHFELIFES